MGAIELLPNLVISLQSTLIGNGGKRLREKLSTSLILGPDRRRGSATSWQPKIRSYNIKEEEEMVSLHMFLPTFDDIRTERDIVWLWLCQMDGPSDRRMDGVKVTTVGESEGIGHPLLPV